MEQDLRERALELATLNQELLESNRGVMALYSELDEKADSLRRTSEVKSRVVSNVSHEFRTPLNSILGLTRLLMARTDGPLTPEQEKQLGFILRSATELSELINDLLDLSKMEAGKIRLHATRFLVGDLFSALRGMSRPLQTRDAVELVFDDVAADLPLLHTDEGKISQVLRNLISNALKFTARGEVRVSAHADGNHVVFTVRDTGVGIAPADQERVFEEFTQLENPLQKSVKGTGLGLSLSRKLGELLAGTLTLESELGKGSAFHLKVPVVHPEVYEMESMVERAREFDPSRAPVLVVEDDRQTMFLYEKYLSSSGFQVVPARSIEDARKLLESVTPAAIVLDVMLEGETSWGFLGELKSSLATRDIPVLVVTVTDRENKARALGADEFWMKPMDKEWLTRKLQTLARRGPVEKLLVIDDDEVSRYLVRRLLAETPYKITEATGGLEGIRLARETLPNVILLDFVMPGMTAFEVLDELKADARTRNIPVIIHTSKDLVQEERERLKEATAAILSKQSLSREVAIARIRDALTKAGVGARFDGKDGAHG
jgi:signal transduction histidine kinase/CheY-like chemotaxis protein